MRMHHCTFTLHASEQSGNLNSFETRIVSRVPKHTCEAECYRTEHFSFTEIPQCPCSTLCWIGSAMSPPQRTSDRPCGGLFFLYLHTNSKVGWSSCIPTSTVHDLFFTLVTLLGEICQINCFPWKLRVMIQMAERATEWKTQTYRNILKKADSFSVQYRSSIPQQPARRMHQTRRYSTAWNSNMTVRNTDCVQHTDTGANESASLF